MNLPRVRSGGTVTGSGVIRSRTRTTPSSTGAHSRFPGARRASGLATAGLLLHPSSCLARHSRRSARRRPSAWRHARTSRRSGRVAGAEKDARTVACSDERVPRAGRAVHEVPGTEMTFLILDDQDALTHQHEKVLLHRLGVVQ